MAKLIRMETGGSDPFRSRSRRAEDKAFADRAWWIRAGFVAVLILIAVGVWLLFR
jgi:hypothetical protein